MIDPNRGYDLIGDIHGCNDELISLLQLLGYCLKNGTWQHPKRVAIFLGDLIDRGPKIRETLHLIHSMVGKQSAICLMGNHELAAIAWNTVKNGDYVRLHNERNTKLINQTLKQFAKYPHDWSDFIKWFYSLPIALDCEKFRAVHACWEHNIIKQLRSVYPNLKIDQDFIIQTKQKNSLAHQVLKYLLTGPCMNLPKDLSMTDALGFTRTIFRTKFWIKNPQTIGDIIFQPDLPPSNIMQIKLTAQQKNELYHYSINELPLFIGHYWMQGLPKYITTNIACLDYSAVRGGKLVAYRFDGECKLDNSKFVWVDYLNKY